jgi:iron complex outermembrane receptor protein
LQAKYQGRRFISDVNDDSIGAFTTVDFDANVPLRFVNDHTSLQLNVLNLFDEDYFTRSTTGSNFRSLVVGSTTVNPANGPFIFVGAPRTVTLTLRTQF